MKRIIGTLTLILILNLTLTAPANIRATIPSGDIFYIYDVSDPFLRAVMKFESNYQADVINPFTGARGVLQILPIMIREVNKFSDIKYIWRDAFDPYKSIEIWYKIMVEKNPEYYPDKACRIWFGTGVQKHDNMHWEDYYNIVMK